MSYALDHPIAERAPESARAAFIRRTYGHLAGAILAFVAIEFVIFGAFLNSKDAAVNFLVSVFGHTPYAWLIVLAVFIGAGKLAEFWARSDTSVAMQYLGLGLYVALEAAIFVPLLCIAVYFTKDPTVLPTAGILTLSIFAGLTFSVFVTRKDFSFLGPILSICSTIALGVIICAILFGFTLGLVFAFAMVALVSAWILYQTSLVLHHYRTDQHVAAALGLFAAIATLFWYILQILLEVSSRSK
jgi:FtsH-binding integral membrane protein